jgi:hypothetical protein
MAVIMAQSPVKFFLGYSPVELTDEQWTEIAYYSALPAEARKKIEMIIGGYRHFCADDAARPTAHQMRAHLKVLRKETSALRDKLKPSNALDAPTSFMAHEAPGGLRRNTQLQREGIHLRENAVYALNALVGWLQMALDEVEDMPRGSARRAWNVGWLVAALDDARKGYTGENIVRSAKDESSREYITTVCHIADPSIQRGTIEGAMRERIKNINRRGVDELPEK